MKKAIHDWLGGGIFTMELDTMLWWPETKNTRGSGDSYNEEYSKKMYDKQS